MCSCNEQAHQRTADVGPQPRLRAWVWGPSCPQQHLSTAAQTTGESLSTTVQPRGQKPGLVHMQLDSEPGSLWTHTSGGHLYWEKPSPRKQRRSGKPPGGRDSRLCICQVSSFGQGTEHGLMGHRDPWGHGFLEHPRLRVALGPGLSRLCDLQAGWRPQELPLSGACPSGHPSAWLEPLPGPCRVESTEQAQGCGSDLSSAVGSCGLPITPPARQLPLLTSPGPRHPGCYRTPAGALGALGRTTLRRVPALSMLQAPLGLRRQQSRPCTPRAAVWHGRGWG